MRILRFILLLFCADCSAQRIAAASDVQPALDPLIAQFNIAHQANVQVIYGSSGKLATQAEAGAPFDIFLSADESWVTRLQAKWPQRAVVEYGRGRLAEIMAKTGSNCAAGIGGNLPLNARVAMANPEHAPYGARAKEVLVRSGVWEPLNARKQIVLAESVSAALQWVTSGAASHGIVAWTQAQSLPEGKFCVRKISANEHAPLVQKMIRLNAASTVDAVWAHLISADSMAAFKRAGLTHD